MIKVLTPKDILALQQCKLPFLVLSDNLWSVLSWRIKGHTKGYYNHVMWMHRPKTVASQDHVYHERPIDKYLTDKHRLKFWYKPAWELTERNAIVDAIEARLRQPWYRRIYDYPGIIGQRLRIPSLNVPSLNFCSEDAAQILWAAGEEFPAKHPSPADINRWCKATEGWEVYGFFDPDIAECMQEYSVVADCDSAS